MLAGAGAGARSRADLARARARAGGGCVVVHGGGPQATALSQRLGIEPRLVGGRRVTDAATLDVMKMVVAGKLNVDLVRGAARGRRAGRRACAASSGVVRAHRRPPRVVSGGGGAPVDFGFGGRRRRVRPARCSRRWRRRATVPVVACLGAGAAGEVLNINADVVASQLAAAVQARRRWWRVTAVGGVRRDKDDPATRLPRLTVAEARAAIADGTVQGGMIPKLEEAFAPLDAGVGAVHIVGAGRDRRRLAAPGSVGTLLS